MRTYIIRRVLLLIPTLLIVTIVIFFLIELIPGDIVDAMTASPGVEEEFDREAVMKKLGLDAPLIVQYLRWMGLAPQVDGRFKGLLQGNLGESWWQRTSVIRLLAAKWSVTIELALLGLIFSQLISLPVGIWSALQQDKLGDYVGRTFAILCISVPYFWVGTIAIVFPSIWWGYMPPIMLIRITDDFLGNLKMFIVPSIILGMSLAGMTMRMTRTMMLEVLRQDYLRTAWAKGLRERVIVFRHALKNALIPVVTLIGLQVPITLGGTVIIENIFSLPGIGRLILDATLQRDQPLVSGALLLFSCAAVTVNLLVDITYAWLDPRIHYK